MKIFRQPSSNSMQVVWQRGAIGAPFLFYLLLAAVLVLALALPVSDATAVEETKVFDPTLSLTGGCGVSTLDPVPDPAEPPCPPPPPNCPTEPLGAHPPSGCFNTPAGVATDEYGNIYVAVAGPEQTNGDEGRIDIFDSSGHFITEVADDDGPGDMAVDSEGNLYVVNRFQEQSEQVQLYEPSVYKPEEGKIEYGKAPVVLVPETQLNASGLGIDRTNDHVFVLLFENSARRVNVYKSAAEGNGKIEDFDGDSPGLLSGFGLGIAVDAAHNRVYLSVEESGESVINVVELSPPHTLLFQIKNSALPAGSFSGGLSLAADEGTGHSFAYDGGAKKVYEFDQTGKYVQTIQHGFEPVPFSYIAVDNGASSPNGTHNPDGRYLFVPSHPTGIGHVFAFGSKPVPKPPVVEELGVNGITETEAVLRAKVNPKGSATEYRLEYLTNQLYEENGATFAGATVASEGILPTGTAGVPISAVLTGLQPETSYRFRITAHSAAGDDEESEEFKTYRPLDLSENCPNQSLLTGPSLGLPDCRAYELVTPANTGGRAPRALSFLENGLFFRTRTSAPSGDALQFFVEGGPIPGFEGNGGFTGDRYIASRTAGGWTTAAAGPDGVEAERADFGGTSEDQGYSFWAQGAKNYLHYPDGHSALIGRGSIGVDPGAKGRFISKDGDHVLFVTRNSGPQSPAVKLEPNAPPDGTEAVYDRTIDVASGQEETHVVSLLPGNIVPQEGEDGEFKGASADGRGVAFTVGSRLFLRVDNQESFEVGDGVTFEGVAEGGHAVFYLEGGNLWRFDPLSNERIPFSSSGDVSPVNISPDGSVAYFLSPSAFGGMQNPNGAEPIAGKPNFYLSREGNIKFVGTVTDLDVARQFSNTVGVVGLGQWDRYLEGEVAKDPSRVTQDGSVLIFEARAELTGFDSHGIPEVYRYDEGSGELTCLSCSPTLEQTGSASLMSFERQGFSVIPLTPYSDPRNLATGGGRAFFESTEPLALADIDGLQDVYEWEEDGVGSCRTVGGCVYLISSGTSSQPEYLIGMSDDGNDVFIESPELLSAEDPDGTPSIYDARVGGGFPQQEVAAECLGETCQPAAVPPPDPPARIEGPGNVVEARKKRCPKGKRHKRVHGKSRCVQRKKHRSNGKHKTAGAGKGRNHR